MVPTPSQDCSFVCGPFEWTTKCPIPQSSVGGHISPCTCRFRGTHLGRSRTWFLFRVIFLRRLRQPLPFTGCACRCGHLTDPNGHHRAACARTGVRFVLESAAARICRGDRWPSPHKCFCAGHGPPTATLEDARRLEVVVDGLPLHAPRWVSALHGDGGPRRGASERDGVALLKSWLPGSARNKLTQSSLEQGAGLGWSCL